ncbi:hypothetical protein EYF80_004002 [Liparis tanakae]|uniref:Uncharacterized protein n=1 Tax=Liparis tanakae TaxID=230148 RepID=A0A4Z2J5U3_9TELE|nr:hypothetical protein EYF80_004002 [Liparis tanakae]
MDVVSSGPAMFARLFPVLPLEEVVYHGIILGTSSTRHTLRNTNQRLSFHASAFTNGNLEYIVMGSMPMSTNNNTASRHKFSRANR